MRGVLFVRQLQSKFNAGQIIYQPPSQFATIEICKNSLSIYLQIK